ncbi:hypothetical protein I5N09_09725 [Serratia marcescens]|uniref:hypothetical protein n=1 Tax=Serratia marcescens TaxID=615 RepID=UPI0011AED6C4|nr:hypothetical protein [Serratia marcescens]MBH3099228.1 hypothetical protein [Serratia marcescens]MBH3218293.1 hypothetical protein [Serratia marcescens]WLS87339.1 hypothetical protein RAM09_21285 [Serratia marcescens]
MSDITKGIIRLSDTVAGEIVRLRRTFAVKLSEKGLKDLKSAAHGKNLLDACENWCDNFCDSNPVPHGK